MRHEKNDFIGSLYRAEYDKLYRMAYRIVKNVQTAEDLVHDAFCLASFQQEKLLTHPKPEAWLMNVIKKLASNEIRRAANRLTIPLEELFSAAASEPEQKIEELFPAGLSAGDRQILIWRFENQISYQEMARRLCISEAGCRSRTARAVGRCRQLMKD